MLLSFVLLYFVFNYFDFLTNSYFLTNRFLLSLNELSDGEVVSFTKNENGYLVKDFDIKASKIFNFPPLKNNSVSIGLNFYSFTISAVISSNTIDTFLFFVGS